MNQFKQMNLKEKAEYIGIILLYPLVMLFAQLGKVCKLFGTRKQQITASVLSAAMILTTIPIMSLSVRADLITAPTGLWTDVGNYDTAWYDNDKDAKIFEISTAQELAGLSVIVNELNGVTKNTFETKTIKLTSAIDLSAHKWYPIGDNSNNNVKRFDGIFDGAGFTISGMYVATEKSYVGFFGAAQSSSEIKDLGIINSVVSVSTGSYVGGLVGDNAGKISNCYFNGTVTGNYFTGGLVGANSSAIKNCYSNSTVSGGNATGGIVGSNCGFLQNCYHTGSVTGTEKVGGVSGSDFYHSSYNKDYHTSINCYSIGDVTGTKNVGGVCGSIQGTDTTTAYNLINCYSAGAVNGTTNVGGIIGINTNKPGVPQNVNDCFWLQGSATAGVGTGTGTTYSFSAENGGTLSAPLTIGETTTSSLLEALNIYTKANQTIPATLFGWEAGTTYPVLSGKYLKIPVTTWAELKADLQFGGEVKLMQDITSSSTDGGLDCYGTTPTILDLNGHKITRVLNALRGSGYVLYNLKNLTIIDTSENGGGTITGGKNFDINSSANNYGGGIYNRGTLTMNGGTITGNTAQGGGGVYNAGTFTMNGGKICNNESIFDGGGVYNAGTFNLNDGEITENKANNSSFGGGVYAASGINITGNAIISGNKNSSSITDNIYLPTDKTITITGAFTGKVGVTTQATELPVTIATAASDYKITDKDTANINSDKATLEAMLAIDKVVLRTARAALTANNFTFTAPSDLTYSGTEKTASVTAKSGVNVNDQDITVKYFQNGAEVAPINAGTYTIKIDVVANDDYKAATSLEVGTFTIARKELNNSDLTYTGLENSYVNTGSAIEPEPTVKYGTITLIKGTDYTLGYSSNIAIGNAMGIVSFKGNYSGTASFAFGISYGAGTKDMLIIPEPNANGWYKDDFNITPNEDYLISSDDISYSTSIAFVSSVKNSSSNVYIKDTNGKIFKYVFVYNLDSNAPTDVKIQYNDNGFKSFLNTITFGIFFKEPVNVTATATDDLSGIDTIQYYASNSAVTVFTNTPWQKSLSLTQNSKKIVYIKVTDKAGNETITNNEGVVVYSDSTVTPGAAAFDKKTDKQTDIDFTMTLNGNTLKEIKNGTATLEKGTDYTISGNIVTVKKAYFAAQANGNVTLTFSFYPMGVENDTTLSTAIATVTVSDSTHVHKMNHTVAKAATCTGDGNTEYWYCSGCQKYFSDENGNTEITLASTVLTKLGHSFTNYVYNNDATYQKDGTETAKCDRCDVTDTCTKSGSKLIDTTAPTGEIKISTSSFKNFVNSITFGLFFKESQTVTITGKDNENGIGLDKIYYYKSETALSLDDVKALSADKWTGGSTLTLSPDWQGVVYAKITDKSGNVLYISSDGLVLDATAPAIAGVMDGGKYCNTATVLISVTDTNLDTVKLDGEAVTLDKDGKFTVSAKDGAQTIVVSDKAGNETTAAITVCVDHIWDDGVITTEPTTIQKGEKTYTCTACGETKTEEINKLAPSITAGENAKYTKGSNDSLTFKSNAPLAELVSVFVDGKEVDKANYTTAEGSTIVSLKPEYISTLSSGTHTLDIKSVTGTASTQFSIHENTVDTTKSVNTSSPKTGDSSNLILWISLLLVSGGLLTCFGINKKRKNVNNK